MSKNFCSLEIFSSYVQTHFFFTKHFISEGFWKVLEIGFKNFCMVSENFCRLQKFCTLVLQPRKTPLEWHKPGLSGLQKVIFAASCKNFCMMRKNFCSLRIFSIFVKTHFFTQHLIFKVFEKFMRWASKIFAWWGKISAGCKNLHPWFCSPEKPHYPL